MAWYEQLDKRRGSRPRCVLLVEGGPEDTASRLTALVDLPDVIVSSSDTWIPYGKPVKRDGAWDAKPSSEAVLSKPNVLVSHSIQRQLRDWWLAVPKRANTPNWDLASTCAIKGKPGLLLIEAKAHAKEMSSAGKSRPTTLNGWENHKRIGLAIGEAAAGLQLETGKSWNISRDHHYQLSNRFAWSWKLASLGVPVVLLYLGFLKAQDMAGDGPLFGSEAEWSHALQTYSDDTIDGTCWEEWLDISGVPLLPLVRAIDQPFDPNRDEAST